MERIVVGTDFSSSSEEAVRLAGEWARNYGAELTLLHVLGVPELAHFELEQPIREHRVLEEAAHEALDAMVDHILVGTRVRTAIVRGRGQIGASAADGIVDFAEEIDAD
ncbi:MAG: universal stress protein, partial [Sandaracinaceae bacterium]